MRWLTLFAVCVVGVLAPAGCVSRSKAQAKAAKAYFAGQAEGNARARQENAREIIVNGQVRNHTIVWMAGMTLAQAVEEAVYTAFSDPRLIILTRGTEHLEVLPKDLLSGKVNPELEAGDVIDIRR